MKAPVYRRSVLFLVAMSGVMISVYANVILDPSFGSRKGVDSFTVSGPSGDLDSATGMWNSCPGSGTDLPAFGRGPGEAPITVNIDNSTSQVCGETAYVVLKGRLGSTITVYPNGPPTCPDLQTTMAHELGHALGLDETTCANMIMLNDGQNRHSVNSSECSVAGSSWQTQTELDNQGPPPPGTPLVLDLDGDGILITNVSYYPVTFDLDGDGVTEQIGWTNGNTSDALLALDLNGNGVVDSGHELFGDASTLPSGETAANGFEALAVYDQPKYGGNGDGRISRRDRVWSRLRLWIDDNHDGVSRRKEMLSLGKGRIDRIELAYYPENEVDGGGNLRWLAGLLWVREGHGRTVSREITDVIFRVLGE